MLSKSPDCASVVWIPHQEDTAVNMKRGSRARFPKAMFGIAEGRYNDISDIFYGMDTTVALIA